MISSAVSLLGKSAGCARSEISTDFRAVARPLAVALAALISSAAIQGVLGQLAATDAPIPGTLRCGAHVSDPVKWPAYSAGLTFLGKGGRFQATRLTKAKPGREVFDATLSPEGRARISGSGSFDSGERWRWELEGLGTAGNRAVAVAGQMFETGHDRIERPRRSCTIELMLAVPTGAPPLPVAGGAPAAAELRSRADLKAKAAHEELNAKRQAVAAAIAEEAKEEAEAKAEAEARAALKADSKASVPTAKKASGEGILDPGFLSRAATPGETLAIYPEPRPPVRCNIQTMVCRIEAASFVWCKERANLQVLEASVERDPGAKERLIERSLSSQCGTTAGLVMNVANSPERTMEGVLHPVVSSKIFGPPLVNSAFTPTESTTRQPAIDRSNNSQVRRGFVFNGIAATNSRTPGEYVRVGEQLPVVQLKSRFDRYVVTSTAGEDCSTCASISGQDGQIEVFYADNGIDVTSILSSDGSATDALGNTIGSPLRDAVGAKAQCSDGMWATCASSRLSGLRYLVGGQECPIDIKDGLETEIPVCAKILGFEIEKRASSADVKVQEVPTAPPVPAVAGGVIPIQRSSGDRGSCLAGVPCVFSDRPFACDFENALRIAEAGASSGQQLGDDLVRAGRCTAVQAGSSMDTETTRSAKVIYVTQQGQHVGYVPVGVFASAAQVRPSSTEPYTQNMIWNLYGDTATFGEPGTDATLLSIHCINGQLMVGGPFSGNVVAGTLVPISYVGLGRIQTVRARIEEGDGLYHTAPINSDSVVISTLLANEALTVIEGGRPVIVSGNGAFTVQTVVRACAKMIAQSPDDWRSYTNARSGVSVDYPAHLVADGPATDITDGLSGAVSRPPTGVRYSSEDGVEIGIYGVPKRGDAPYRHLCRARCDGETYAVRRAGMAVVSGRRGRIIYYRRCLVSSDQQAFHCFELDYPEGKAAVMGSVIERMSGTLR